MTERVALEPAAGSLLALLTLLAIAAGGCVERTITITSEPPGALVWLNDREIGRTPVDADFVHYGVYDVRLLKDGYEPLLTSGKAMPPLWDNLGLDFVAELLPVTLTSDVRWHYDLDAQPEDAAAARAELVERAAELRGTVGRQP